MQYHLNGFRVGDPRIAEATAEQSQTDEVDVIIVGCGPAGLTLAAQLATIPGIRTRIFDRNTGSLEIGQADGVACRSMEMFEAYGFSEKVLKEAYWVNETTFWRPDPETRGLMRADRIQDVEDDLSDMPHVVLNQARVHECYLEVMRAAPSRLAPEYARQAIAVECREGEDYPIRVTFDCLDRPGERQVVRTRYLVGCDGARSTIRSWMGLELKGEATRQLWGVMDVLAVTDFPDIRLKSVIQSAEHGSVLIIPREGGYLVRLYIELDELRDGERASDRNVTSRMLEAKAQAIIAPYSFEVKSVAWCSAYEIGQRVCDAFDEVPSSERRSRTPRIFIAGDACHTHSPKAGQGMNVSMADAFNLGWKLAAVIRGQSQPELLHSYSEERRAKAKELIDFDRDLARLFSAKPKTAEERTQFQRYFQKHGRYTAGVETTYGPSRIVGGSDNQDLARGLLVGKRFHSAPVIRLADAKPLQLGHVLKADGRWRLLAFADRTDTGSENGRITALCESLQKSPRSPLMRYTPAEADIDSVFDVRAVFQQSVRELDLMAMPKLLLPRKGRFELTDYEKIFCPDLKTGLDIFDMRGIDRDEGVLVVVRPDQFVSLVVPLDAEVDIARFFDGFMVPQNTVV